MFQSKVLSNMLSTKNNTAENFRKLRGEVLCFIQVNIVKAVQYRTCY